MNELKKRKKSSLAIVFKTIIWPRKKIILVGLILIAIGRLAGLVLPWKTKVLLDEVIPNKDYSGLWGVLILVIVSILLQAVTAYLLTRIVSVQAEYLIKEYRVGVQKKVLSLPIQFFNNAKSGALVSRIMVDVEGVRNLIGEGLIQLVGGTFTAIAALIMLLRINIGMTLMILMPIVIFGLVASKAFRFMHPVFMKQGEINALVTGRLNETLSGVRVIKSFNAEVHEMNVFEAGVDDLYQNVKKSMKAKAGITSSATLLLGIASTGIMGIGGYYIMKGTMTVGDFLFFTLLLAYMIGPILQISNLSGQLLEAFASMDRTEELMRMESEEDIPNRLVQLKSIKGDIKFDNVSFSYEHQNEVLSNISFFAPKGTMTALVGTSGSGKSTIAALVATFYNPESGTITIDDQDLTKVNLSSYRRNLGVVLQDEFLFEGTIRENILLSKPDATQQQLLEAIVAANVNKFTDGFTKGIETIIGERGVKLSGGQRQRITIARALLADPKILILDEATSSLDNESEVLIQKSLVELMKGRTTFVIAHRLSTIKRADQILVIETGRIVERGTHEELINLGGRYFDLYNYQARI